MKRIGALIFLVELESKQSCLLMCRLCTRRKYETAYFEPVYFCAGKLPKLVVGLMAYPPKLPARTGVGNSIIFLI